MVSIKPTGLTWRAPTLCLIVSLLIIGGIFWNTLADMMRHWTASTAYNHGFLIPIIVAYIVYDRLGDLRRFTPRPAWLALVFISSSLIIWLIGTIADARVIQQFSLVALIQWSCVAILGWRIGWKLAFPLFFLFFAVPFGEFLVPDLQNFTANTVIKLLKLTGIPVFYEGVFISIPTGNFHVAEVCSGLRFLLAAVAIGALMANMMLKQFWRRCLFMALVVVVPIVANGLRAFGIIMLAYWTDNKLATGFDHIIYGWVFISLILLALLGIGYLLREDDKTSIGVEMVEESGTIAASANSRFGLLAISAMIISLSVTSVVTAKLLLAPPAEATRLAASHLEVDPVWKTEVSSEPKWRPVFPNADQLLLRRYRNGEELIDTATAYFHWQRDRAEIIGWQNKMFSEKSWKWFADGKFTLSVAGNILTPRYNLYKSRTDKRVTTKIYYVAGRLTGSAQLAKLYQIEATLLAKSPRAATIVLSTEYRGDPKIAFKRLQSFAKSVQRLGLP